MAIIKGNSPENYIFVPGTKAYGIHLGRKDEKEKCKACNGKGKIVLEGKSYTCPACSGWGFHHVQTPDEWLLTYEMPMEITQINVREKEIVYFFGCNGYKAINVFLTRKEALKEAEKRNRILREQEEMEKELNEQE